MGNFAVAMLDSPSVRLPKNASFTCKILNHLFIPKPLI